MAEHSKENIFKVAPLESVQDTKKSVRFNTEMVSNGPMTIRTQHESNVTIETAQGIDN